MDLSKVDQLRIVHYFQTCYYIIMEAYVNLILFVIIGFAFVIFFRLLVSQFRNLSYPYYKNPYFISKSEQAFMKVLESIVKDRYYIFCQVNVHSLLKVQKNEKEYWKYMNKIKQKSVDFVIADKESCNPLLVIELDDYSHNFSSRKERDVFINKAFKTAGIPLLRIPTSRYYDMNSLSSEIFSTIRT